MRGLAIINPGALKRLERTIFVTGSITLVASVFLLGNAGFNYFRYNDTEAKLAVTKQQIHTLSDTIAKSKRLKFPATNVKELTAIQTSLDQYSSVYDCLLTEVNSTNDESQYQTRYLKNAGEAGWKQFSIQCQMIGSLNNVMSLLREVTSGAIPTELQTVEISPLETSRNGHPQILAKVTLQVMRQEKV